MKTKAILIMLVVFIVMTISAAADIQIIKDEFGTKAIDNSTRTITELLDAHGWTITQGGFVDKTYTTYDGQTTDKLSWDGANARIKFDYATDYPYRIDYEQWNDGTVAANYYVEITGSGGMGLGIIPACGGFAAIQCAGGCVAGSVAVSSGWHKFSIIRHGEDDNDFIVDGTNLTRVSTACPVTQEFQILHQGAEVMYYNNISICKGTEPCPLTGGGGAPTASPINFTWDYPTNNSQFNTAQLNFSFAVLNASYPANVTLYKNGSFYARSENLLNNSYNYMLVNFTGNESSYNLFNYIVNDNASQTYNGTNRTIYIDNTNPWITSTYSNNQAYFGNSINTSFTFFDDFLLYSYKILLDGVVYDNKTELNTMTYIYNLSIRTDNLTSGTHSFVVNSSDGHTAKEIGLYSYSKTGSKGLKYSFGSDYIEITPDNILNTDSFDTEKKKDKYKFKHKRMATTPSETYTVTSSRKISIIPNSAYKGWLVVGDLGKWLDFQNDISSNVITQRIDANTVKVTVDGLSKKDIEFESIGDLNSISRTYYFFVGNYTSTVVSPVYETTNNSFIVSFDYNSSFVTDIFASLIYDGTNKSFTNKSVGTRQINFTQYVVAPFVAVNATNKAIYWDYTVTGVNGTLHANTTSQNQTIYHSFFAQAVEGYDATIEWFEGDILNFNITAKYLTTGANISAAYHTLFGTTKTDSVYNNTLAYGSITLPRIGTYNETANLTGILTFNYAGTEINKSVNGSSFFVYQPTLIECGGALTNTTGITVRLIDEITLAPLNWDTMLFNAQTWHTNPLYYRNFTNLSASTDQIQFCIYPEDATYLTNADATATRTGWFPRSGYLVNATIGANVTQDIYLILNNQSSLIIYHVNDIDGNPIPNAIVKVQRKYASCGGCLKMVENAKTNSEGKALGRLTMYDVDYKFTVDLDGVQVYESEETRIFDTNLYFVVNTLPNFIEDVNNLVNLPYTFTFDNATNRFTFTYADTSGLTRNGCMDVVKRSSRGDTKLYSECVKASSATLTYNLTPPISGTYIGSAYIDTDRQHSLHSIDEIIVERISNPPPFGIEGLILSLLIIGTCAMIGIRNPTVMIVMTLLSTLGCVLMGLLNMTYGMIVVIMIAGIVYIVKVKT